jgi:glucokinase
MSYLAFDIGGTQVRAALATGQQIIASRSEPWPPERSADDDLTFVAELADRLLAEHAPPTPLRTAGVALAALVDERGAVVSWPNRPSWRGLPFRTLLQTRLGLPVAIEDDANAAALAEHIDGAARGFRDALVIMAGTGIGAGLILNGRLHRGRRGWAGELGHLTMQIDGPECACGRRGCLQMLASGRALERVAVAQGWPSAAALTRAAAHGEPAAVAAVADAGRWLGLAAANAVNLLDLEAVVIGGGLSALDDPWWSAIQTMLDAQVLNATHRPIILRKATLPDSAGLLGAMHLAVQHSAAQAYHQERSS